VSQPLVSGDGITVFGTQISAAELLTGAFAAVVVPGLAALYRFTSLGTQLRATAIDPYAASLCGINVNRVSLITWGMAGALSALSALLISGLRPGVDILFMTLLALRAFSAALVGGLTSLWGGFLAGLLLGIAEQVIQYKTPVQGVTELTLALGILLLVVLAPRGLTRAQY
jgi:branched-chain amino acid transport system permease protein